MAPFLEWFQASPWRPAVPGGAIVGGVLVAKALLRDDGVAGVVIAVIVGVAFGAWMGASTKRTTRDLSNRTPEQEPPAG